VPEPIVSHRFQRPEAADPAHRELFLRELLGPTAGVGFSFYAGHIPPGGAAAVAAHEGVDETIYIVSGKGVLPDGGELGAGTLVHLPAGVAHGLRNPGPEPLELVAVVHPARS